MFQDTLEIEVIDVQPVTIHGSLYYQLAFRVVGSNAVQQTRLNPEAFYPDPQPGDRAEVNVLMGNIMGATRLSGAS